MTTTAPASSPPVEQASPMPVADADMTLVKHVTDMVSVTRSPQDWADQINAATGAAVEKIVHIGRVLIAARVALRQHGAWEKLFKGHKDAVERPVPFTVDTARRYMAIARHPTLSNGTHGSHLPASWRTLYELTSLAPEVIESAIESGTLTPETQRAYVIMLKSVIRERFPRKARAPLLRRLYRYAQTDAGWEQARDRLLDWVLKLDTAVHRCECGHEHTDLREP